MTRHPVLDTAVEGLRLGLSIVAIHAIGEPVWEWVAGDGYRRAIDRKTGAPALHGPKRPIGQWKIRTEKPMAPHEIAEQLLHPEYGWRRGIALVCGYGQVECLEFDDVDTWERFQTAALGRPELVEPLQRICTGYFERSPRGSPHLLYRCEDLAGDGILARRPEIVAGDNGAKKLKVLIEVRGPGHMVTIAPTPGTCHPTGKSYELINGGLASITSITPAERKLVHDFCRTFDEVPPELPAPIITTRFRHTKQSRRSFAGEKPGEHYNRICSIEMWRQMLGSAPLCWEYIGAVGSRPHCWIHPTASSSLSAHLTPANTLAVFSTSTPLAAWSPGKKSTHSPFHVYALVCHHGNHTDAAKALRAIGYGSRDTATKKEVPGNAARK